MSSICDPVYERFLSENKNQNLVFSCKGKYWVGSNPEKPDYCGVASCLDNLLLNMKFLDLFLSSRIELQMWSFYDLNLIYTLTPSGVVVNKKNYTKFVKEVISRYENRIHETTDHLILVVKYKFGAKTITQAYLSLENSVRSTKFGEDFSKRWPKIKELIDALRAKGVDFVACSEAGRDVFKTEARPLNGDIEAEVLHKWDFFVKDMEQSGYKQLCLSRNNEETFGPEQKRVSFGVALFILNTDLMDDNEIKISYEEVHHKPMNSFGAGSVLLTISHKDEELKTLFVHAPLNFAKPEDQNPFTDYFRMLNTWCMENNVAIVCGDLNTVDTSGEGPNGFDRFLTLLGEMSNFKIMMEKPKPTFFSAYIDNEVPKGDFPDLVSTLKASS